MSIEEAILEKLRTLPPDKQSELVAMADATAARTDPKTSFRSVRGLSAEYDTPRTSKNSGAKCGRTSRAISDDGSNRRPNRCDLSPGRHHLIVW